MRSSNAAEDVRRVISASRRVDMIADNPEGLTEILKSRVPPEHTHTVVLWTKDPAPMFEYRPLRRQLERYDQLFLHLTVTGLGGGALEPRVPPPQAVLRLLPDLIDFLQSPRRLRLRFDPLLRVRHVDGRRIENLAFFDELAPIAASFGLHDITISWVQLYRKVTARLARNGWAAEELSPAQRTEEAARLKEKAARWGITLHGCCVPEMPRSRCIDGELLTELHPLGLPASTRRAKGQRPACGCTESLDIGWYTPCRHGCLYCYANPKAFQDE